MEVTGIGGVFFKANDPKGPTDWYRRHLGTPEDAGGYVVFSWREEADRFAWVMDPEGNRIELWEPPE
jgi:hypothetical protein